MEIKLYASNKGYAFRIGDFFSPKHHSYVSFAKPYYSKVRYAYSDALHLLHKKRYLLSSQNYDLFNSSPENPEENLKHHYDTILAGYLKEAKSLQKLKHKTEIDEIKREGLYRTVKDIASEMLSLDYSWTSEIVKKCRKIINSYLKDFLNEDLNKKDNNALEDLESLGELPSEEEMDFQSFSSSKNNFKKTSALNSKDFVEDFVEDILNDYAEKACECIEPFIENTIFDIDTKKRKIYISTINKRGFRERILCLKINEDFFLCNVYPLGSLAESCPCWTKKFYQKYWKPIVEVIGHYYLNFENAVLLMDRLPDVPKKGDFYVFPCISPKGALKQVSLEFKNGKDFWSIKKVKTANASSYISDDVSNIDISSQPSEFAEEELRNAIVRCIDPSLETVFNKTGIVKEIINYGNYISLLVDFGNHEQYLREKQVEVLMK